MHYLSEHIHRKPAARPIASVTHILQTGPQQCKLTKKVHKNHIVIFEDAWDHHRNEIDVKSRSDRSWYRRVQACLCPFTVLVKMNSIADTN